MGFFEWHKEQPLWMRRIFNTAIVSIVIIIAIAAIYALIAMFNGRGVKFNTSGVEISPDKRVGMTDTTKQSIKTDTKTTLIKTPFLKTEPKDDSYKVDIKGDGNAVANGPNSKATINNTFGTLPQKHLTNDEGLKLLVEIDKLRRDSNINRIDSIIVDAQSFDNNSNNLVYAKEIATFLCKYYYSC